MRKRLDVQFTLQGTALDIEKIEKEINSISTHKEIIAFNSNGKQEDKNDQDSIGISQ